MCRTSVTVLVVEGGSTVRCSTALAATAVATILALTGCSGSSPSVNVAKANLSAPPAGACLKMGAVDELTQERVVDCASAHEGQVYALLALPAGIHDASVHQQVTDAKASLVCPDVKAWAGYKGNVPLGLFRTWRFPTKLQIANGADWAACVAILAPGPDHHTLRSTVGSLSGKLGGKASPLPLLGQCAPTHTNTAFTPVTCVAGSQQWVWLGAHRKPAGAYPGKAKAKKVADAGCVNLVVAQGRGGAWAYFPTSAADWAKTQADWSCWMPIANIKH
jgi:hypothetical protein